MFQHYSYALAIQHRCPVGWGADVVNWGFINIIEVNFNILIKP